MLSAAELLSVPEDSAVTAELSVEEDAEVVIMQVVTDENGEELLEGVEDDDIANAVFNIVMERAEAEDEE